jgi:hypothetical protein
MLLMCIIKGKEHMIKKKEKEHKLTINKHGFLTPLQKELLLSLAVNKPQTKNEAVRAIGGNYRSGWDALKELENKNLIKAVSQKFYRGREYPRYWVTENGILLALSEKTKLGILLRRTQEIYPENRNLQFLIEAIPILGETAFNMVRLAVAANGKIDQNDLISIFAAQKKLDDEELGRYNLILKKYPERYKQHADYIKRVSKNLKDLSEMFDV